MGKTETENRLKMQKRAQELFKEGCFQGDVARTPVEDLSETDVLVLETINETALTLGHKFSC